MPRRYWLFKSEPGAYSYDDLTRDGVAEWDGVRNFQARNLLRDEIKEGDGVLFYHSSADPLAVVGTAVVARGGYPDHTAWDPRSDHLDPRSTPANPVWYMVDIKAQRRFARLVTLEELRHTPGLEDMMLLRRGARLSVQPVSPDEWAIIVRLGTRRG
jgi:predicted RNA-binding protein with PUA-like domain